jgi:hypothetical protein
MKGMTIDRAIRALQQAREWVGGGASLLFVDVEPVLQFIIDDERGCVEVTGLEQSSDSWDVGLLGS